MAKQPDLVKIICHQIELLEDRDEVRTIAHYLTEKLRHLQHLAILNLENGMLVKFTDRKGKIIRGTIRGLTPNHTKNVPVVIDSGQKWRVAASLLRIVGREGIREKKEPTKRER